MGDPCGRVGNGQIKDAYVTVEDAWLAQRGASTRAEEIIDEIQAGTSTIRNLADGVDYYAFPERLSVINTLFNGSVYYDDFTKL